MNYTSVVDSLKTEIELKVIPDKYLFFRESYRYDTGKKVELKTVEFLVDRAF